MRISRSNTSSVEILKAFACATDAKLLMDRLGIMATYRQSTPTNCIWIKPDGDTVKLNSDASVTNDHARTGGTIRDCNGDVLLAYSGSGGTRANVPQEDVYTSCEWLGARPRRSSSGSEPTSWHARKP
ncbi:hypothetical protein IFM89_034127 [Coptis chinensis]|uniref:Uncharacterized protein n=1 Tax=Coptis chinensis TaxID=261450 RepID=A0A835I5I9_9MAGN|nr:hypothetical protein IFM89_034127 [Coptis chinensis]